jgi:hypothetical protein
MHPPQDSSHKNGQQCCPFELADRSGKNYILQCSTAIGVAVLLPFLGVSSLNFGPLARVAFFLGGLCSQRYRRTTSKLPAYDRDPFSLMSRHV